MGKSHRGKGVRNEVGRGRGTCPICHRTGTKVLYEVKKSEEETIKVCKRCKKTKLEQAA